MIVIVPAFVRLAASEGSCSGTTVTVGGTENSNESPDCADWPPHGVLISATVFVHVPDTESEYSGDFGIATPPPTMVGVPGSHPPDEFGVYSVFLRMIVFSVQPDPACSSSS